MLMERRLAVTMLAAGAHCVRTGTEEVGRAMLARVWKTFATAEEAVQVCFAEEAGDRGGDSACQPVLVKRIKGRVADQMVDVPVPRVTEDIMGSRAGEEEKLVPQQ